MLQLVITVSFAIVLSTQLIQLSIVLMVLSDWLVDQLNTKEELKFVLMEYGVQSVMMIGVVLMLQLYVNNLDMLTLDVRSHY